MCPDSLKTMLVVRGEMNFSPVSLEHINLPKLNLQLDNILPRSSPMINVSAETKLHREPVGAQGEAKSICLHH